MVEGSPEKMTSPKPKTNSSIDDESSVGSTNRRREDEALDDTNATAPMDSADDAWIKNNCSSELSPEVEPSELQWAILEVLDLNRGRGFEIQKGIDERILAIYI
jgi:hypothetical protein